MKGQGSLEYLLIIGGGILIAVIIIGVVVPLANTSGSGNQGLFAQGQCKAFTKEQCNLQTLQIGEDYFICQFDYTQKECTAKKVDEILSSCSRPTEDWQPGKVYLLEKDVSTSNSICFDITGFTASDLTLSCGGHKITQTDPEGYGISWQNSKIIIQNCVISGGDNGIYFGGPGTGAENRVLYNTIENSSAVAIGISGSDASKNRIEGNIIRNSSGKGIIIEGTGTQTENIIKNNNIFCDGSGTDSISIPNTAQSNESGENSCPPGTCHETYTGKIVCNASDNCDKSC